MKKPNFIEIRLPGRKSTFLLAKRKYLSRLEGKVLKVNFCRKRERKIFEYLVTGSSPYRGWVPVYGTYKDFWSLKLKLKVPEQDPEIVP